MRVLILLLAVGLLAVAQAGGALPASLALIVQFAHSSAPYHDVAISDADADAYFAGPGAVRLPVGVSHLRLAAQAGVISGMARIDFSKLPRAPLIDPLLILFSGVHQVEADARVDSSQAPAAQLTVTTVKLDGDTIPNSLIDAALAVLVQPQHPNIGRTFQVPLPPHATSATVQDGEVVIHY